MRIANSLYPRILVALLLVAAVVISAAMPAVADDDDVNEIKLPEGQVVLEFVGRPESFSTGSNQFGYFTFIRGLESVLGAGPTTAATAQFTFYNSTTNVRSQFLGGTPGNAGPGPNGAWLRVIKRTGTTTIYQTTTNVPDFSSGASFQSDKPILISELTQVVTLDLAANVFTVVFTNKIVWVAPFSAGGQTYQLGRVGDIFRSTLYGHSDSPATGWFSAYAVGIDRHGD